VRRKDFYALVAGSLLASFALVLVLAVSPQLHERLHKDSSQPSHECAVTLLASGKCDQSSAPPLLRPPQPAVQFEKTPALNPLWVPAPFLSASVFEHAPPALS
jgi:hypothetical protein